MKKAFTLAEMLVTLSIIAVVAALTMPVIMNTNSSNLKALFKAAYTNTQVVVTELINDVSIYPSGEFTDGTLCSNFFSKVTTVGSYDCTGSTVVSDPNGITNNGMRWYGLDANFSDCPTMNANLPAGNCIAVTVDVDGEGKGLNDPSASDDSRDILKFYIYDTGKVTVPSGTQEYTYLTQ